MREIAIIAIVFVAGIFIIKLLWAWTIPEIFPGACQQNLIASNISWFTAFKVSLLFSLITTVARISKK